MIFHFVLRSARRPTGGVGVSPFGCDGDFARLDFPRLQPGGEEIFAFPVRTGGIDVADAGVMRRVEHFVRVRLHRRRIVSTAEIGGVIKGDVSGPPECRHAQPELRYHRLEHTVSIMKCPWFVSILFAAAACSTATSTPAA